MVFALLLLLASAASATFEESFRAGLLALQRNDLKTAETNLEAAAKLAPNDGRVWVALSQTYQKQGKQANAGAAAVRAESLYFEAAQPLLQQGRFAEAIPILTSATQYLKNSAQLELALGVAYYGLRRFEEAAGAFLRTIEIAPETDQPYVFLGKFLDQIPTRLPEVTKRFSEYETANPSSFTGYFLHAKALNAQSSEPETARKLLEKALTINERNASAHFELGAMLDRAQHYADAAREFERAAELAPTDAATHYRLSRVYDRLGKHEEAQAEREKHAKLEEAQREAVK